MRKVLILAYHYPPDGGAGVQRVAKFAKYLPEFGYEPVVVAGKGKNVTVKVSEDDSLTDDVKGVKKYDIEQQSQTGKLTRFYNWMFLTDIQWCRAAFEKASEVIEVERPDVLFVSMSPFFMCEPAMKLADKFNLPLIIDMRDPWVYDPYYCYPSKLHFLIDKAKMQKACQKASAVIMNTPNSLDVLKKAFPQLPSQKLFCITNGYDKNDFENTEKQSARDDRFTIVHTGHFQTSYSIQTNSKVRRLLTGGGANFKDKLRYFHNKPDMLARSPYYLFMAIRELLDEGKIKTDQILLKFAGNLSESDKLLIKMFKLDDIVETTGYLSHSKSIGLMSTADVLYLPLHWVFREKLPLIVPGKTYEYMATGKPIFATVPDGDCKSFLMQYRNVIIAKSGNITDIKNKLLDAMKIKGQNYRQPNLDFVQGFERKHLTEKLTQVIDYVIDGK